MHAIPAIGVQFLVGDDRAAIGGLREMDGEAPLFLQRIWTGLPDVDPQRIGFAQGPHDDMDVERRVATCAPTLNHLVLGTEIGDRPLRPEIVPDGALDRLDIEVAVDEELEEAHVLPGDVNNPPGLCPAGMIVSYSAASLIGSGGVQRSTGWRAARVSSRRRRGAW